MQKRPVVCSDGKEYPSISAAAQIVSVCISSIQTAMQYTKHGLYRSAGGYQWAFADEVPEVWPAPTQRQKPVVNSNGEEFSSLSEAARNTTARVGSISTAARSTRRGLYRTAGGLQWAYAGEVPEIWPEKESTETSKVEPIEPIYPPIFTGIPWRKVSGHSDYEVSSLRGVRRVGERSLMPRVDRQGVSLVCIDDRLYSIVDLMMLAFVGPKPYGYTVQRLKGESEVLSNLCYAPRKPRKSWKPGMTHREIMDQLKEQLRD